MKSLKRFARRVGAILARPEAEWAVIAGEQLTAAALFVRYIAILAVIPALGRAIGASLVGGYAPILPSLAGALVIYASGFVIVYGLAFLVDALAPRFGARRDFSRALDLMVYAATPVWLAGIFLVVPGLSFLMIFGIYALYLAWSGLPVLMRAPPERSLAYTGAIASAALVAVIIVGVIATPFFRPA
ncbi:MAG TPA: Yip1 family protein [Xanthobacteraceae bacterium]|jgi:lysylphosphatidylglycerol synthetase-like protein (DUF2156 family)|nr:Yip1 family protein [Xanthobacteraceae bacterium]